MSVVTRRDLEADRRTIVQNAKLAIRDIYDAIVELVTNADDRYQVLGTRVGRIEIEVERRRQQPSLLRVRDFADGMDSKVMERKLSRLGGRVSGLELGFAVRGTNSRGAKDVAALGEVLFESIAQDGRYHRCRITPFLEFELEESRDVTPALRRSLGIAEGTGTFVTIELDSSHAVPLHDTLRQRVGSLVRLRDIMRDPSRTVVLRDVLQGREHELAAPKQDGNERVNQRLTVPGYPEASAKLVIYRSNRRFEREKDRFRHGGILVKSRHAIHEATLLDSSLEADQHALWFWGRLTCEYVDELWNEFDERFERKLEPDPRNPVPILDPSRKSGLTRDHPFVAALYNEALKRLRPLVEEERKREEHERARVETRETRKRLDALERAAIDFLSEFAESELSRDPEVTEPGSRFRERGFSMSPPFAQLIVGHPRIFRLKILVQAFPEVEPGSTVQLEHLTREVELSDRFVELIPDATGEVLEATWSVKGLMPTAASGLRARVGPVAAESTVEVLESEADRYSHVKGLQFQRKRYQMRIDKGRKNLRLLAPIELAEAQDDLALSLDGLEGFVISGAAGFQIRPNLGIAVCEFDVKCLGQEPRSAQVKATLGSHEAITTVVSVPPLGGGITIRLEDIDLGNQRYRWRRNELELAGRHPSLRRYLGPKAEGFPGQESKHFRVLIAEIVADAVCARLLDYQIQSNPFEYEGADWNLYYAEFSRYMTRFLPIAHGLVLPDSY